MAKVKTPNKVRFQSKIAYLFAKVSAKERKSEIF